MRVVLEEHRQQQDHWVLVAMVESMEAVEAVDTMEGGEVMLSDMEALEGLPIAIQLNARQSLTTKQPLVLKEWSKFTIFYHQPYPPL